ncbi:hypothetical protein NQ315_013285 [Exocentrus adspersus]|uniref:Uncharacterized protein n=1 Tax=Exocentrus adspersus TaxID=1586481 RepID=A0AAV8VLM3_9CUCU|nr:hypothetical protein NQ315_013285 [Exocentrus adspersus]
MQKSAVIPRIETVVDMEAAVVNLETDVHTATERSTTETVERIRQDYVDELLTSTSKTTIFRDRRTTDEASRTGNGKPGRRRTAHQLGRSMRAALDEHIQENWRRHNESL